VTTARQRHGESLKPWYGVHTCAARGHASASARIKEVQALLMQKQKQLGSKFIQCLKQFNVEVD
jgi:hypothetical protein